jgi:ribosomal protein S18 acetylase RimI-like enzyme
MSSQRAPTGQPVETTVRMADQGDAEAITQVHIRGWQWAYRDLLPASYLASLYDEYDERLDARRRKLAQPRPDHRLLVAVRGLAGRDQDAVVGFVNCGSYRDKEEPTDGIGEVYAIYVAADVAGTGAGRALMDAAVGWMAQRRLNPVRLWVLEGNARALAFYRRYGFREDGARHVDSIERIGHPPIVLPELRLSLGIAG